MLLFTTKQAWQWSYHHQLQFLKRNKQKNGEFLPSTRPKKKIMITSSSFCVRQTKSNGEKTPFLLLLKIWFKTWTNREVDIKLEKKGIIMQQKRTSLKKSQWTDSEMSTYTGQRSLIHPGII